MRLGTARTSRGDRVILDNGEDTKLLRFPTLAAALTAGILDDPDGFDGDRVANVNDLELGPAVGAPGKVICVGHNFRQHILEMGHGLPDHPNVFSKFAEALIGPYDPIVLNPDAEDWDWEAELALVIAKPARRVSTDDAHDFIAGYTVANDISARDWQRRGSQWLLGKTFEQTTPIGPWLVTTEEVDPNDGLTITCTVDGVEKQRSTTSDLLFGPAFLVSYLSQVLTLQPGDVVLTGTPAGVGAARSPVEWLTAGQTVTTEITGLGRLSNVCVAPDAVSTSH